MGRDWFDSLPGWLTWDSAIDEAERQAAVERLSERFGPDRPIWSEDDNDRKYDFEPGDGGR